MPIVAMTRSSTAIDMTPAVRTRLGGSEAVAARPESLARGTEAIVGTLRAPGVTRGTSISVGGAVSRSVAYGNVAFGSGRAGELLERESRVPSSKQNLSDSSAYVRLH